MMMVDGVALDKSEEAVDQSLVDRLLRNEDDGDAEEEEVVEVEVSRGDFRGILRELRTLKNVIIEGVVDGVKNFKNNDFNSYGYLQTSGSPDSNLESSKIQPKQEDGWSGGDDFDGDHNYDDDDDEKGEEDSESKVKRLRRLTFNSTFKAVPYDDSDEEGRAQRKKSQAGIYKKRYRPEDRIGNILRNYCGVPSPKNPTDKCEVILHELNERLIMEYKALLCEAPNKDKRRGLALLREDQTRWFRKYKHQMMDKLPNWVTPGVFIKSKSCSMCKEEPKFTTFNRTAMEQHMEDAHNVFQKRIDCQYCGDSIVARKYNSHVDVVHLKVKSEDAMIENLAKTRPWKMKCDLCLKFISGSLFALSRHKESKHGIKPERVACSVPGCPRKPLKEKLQYHMKNYHGKGNKDLRKCKRCNFTTGHLSVLMKHYKEEHPDEELEQIFFEEKPRVTNRKRTKVYLRKNEPREYICEQCGFVTSSTVHLRRHFKEVHKGLRPFGCEQCDRRFLCSNDLKAHKARRHDGIKNYICDECSYLCSTKYELKAHKTTIHGGTWNYRCHYEGCPFGAHQEKKLHRHIDSVHKKIMRYQCPDCPRTSAEKGNILNHWRMVHRGIRRYTCNLCKYGSEKRTRLITHLSLDHNIEVKVVDQRMVCSKPDCLTIYSSEKDPLFRQMSDEMKEIPILESKSSEVDQVVEYQVPVQINPQELPDQNLTNPIEGLGDQISGPLQPISDVEQSME